MQQTSFRNLLIVCWDFLAQLACQQLLIMLLCPVSMHNLTEVRGEDKQLFYWDPLCPDCSRHSLFQWNKLTHPLTNVLVNAQSPTISDPVSSIYLDKEVMALVLGASNYVCWTRILVTKSWCFDTIGWCCWQDVSMSRVSGAYGSGRVIKKHRTNPLEKDWMVLHCMWWSMFPKLSSPIWHYVFGKLVLI